MHLIIISLLLILFPKARVRLFACLVQNADWPWGMKKATDLTKSPLSPQHLPIVSYRACSEKLNNQIKCDRQLGTSITANFDN